MNPPATSPPPPYLLSVQSTPRLPPAHQYPNVNYSHSGPLNSSTYGQSMPLSYQVNESSNPRISQSQPYYNLPRNVHPGQSRTATHNDIHRNPSHAQWKEYMNSLGTTVARLDIRDNSAQLESSLSMGSNKPLPPIPRGQTDASKLLTPERRPVSAPALGVVYTPPAPPPVPPRPNKLQYAAPAKSFRPTFHPSEPQSSHEALLQPPPPPGFRMGGPSHSDSSLPRSAQSSSTVIDLTTDEESDDAHGKRHTTPQTPRQKYRAESEVAVSPATGSPSAVRCSGFTRTGQPCKRVVKVSAPYLSFRNDIVDAGDEDQPRLVGRYCKDHAGLVCQADGFYWRGSKGRSGVWVSFKDFIPVELGQQTQTLLRMTMESPLTAKELPGFLYAYELRDLASSTTSYFKVGRTDNVPRRMGQWSKQCSSHTPTLRDIFPLTISSLRRRPSALGSLLPGAVQGGTDDRRMVPAVKRWERLVHLELADRSASSCGKEYTGLLKPCDDCGATHREIFPLGVSDRKSDTYEQVVVEVIERWERFVRAICDK